MRKNCALQINIKLKHREERQRKHREVLMMSSSKWMLLSSLFFSTSLVLYTNKQVFFSDQEKTFYNTRNWKHPNSINRELVKWVTVLSNNR